MRTQDLIDRLDKQYALWDLYRASMGHWVVTIESEGQKYQGSMPTIDEALSAALAWVPLPLVPVKPKLLNDGDLKPCKKGNFWRVKCWRVGEQEQDCGVQFHTKYAAKKWISEVMEKNADACQAWPEKWGWTEGKVEGVDFRFK